MITNLQIVEEARTYLGTPFHHIGRSKEFGVDCVGLVVGVAKHFNLSDHDLLVYSRQPDGETLERELGKVFTITPLIEAQPGDMVSFWIRHKSLPCHVGILTQLGLIHTYYDKGKVVEHRIDERWSKRISQVFRYPKIEVVTHERFEWLRL